MDYTTQTLSCLFYDMIFQCPEEIIPYESKQKGNVDFSSFCAPHSKIIWICLVLIYTAYLTVQTKQTTVVFDKKGRHLKFKKIQRIDESTYG